LGYILAFIVKFGMNIPDENFIAYLRTWPWLTMSALALFYFYGLYGSYRWRWSEVFASLICVVLFQALVAMAFSYLFRGFSFPRTVLLTVPVVQLVLLGLWRRIAWVLEKRLQNVKKVIVVGQPLDAVILADKLETATGGILKVCGIVLESDTANNENILSKITEHWPVLGEIPELGQWIDSVDPDQVFVCSNLSQEIKADVVNTCVAKDKKVGLVPDLYEIMLVQSRMEQVDDVPIFTVGRLAIAEESLIIKRMTDIILSLMALAAAAPFFALVTAAIKLDSKGPVFYRQKRLTLQGKPFYLFKFRTMIVDAELSSGPVLATENDPRITRVGNFLRATRIDEFPQLLNVLKGDMSIVGPRPERPFFVNELVKETPEYAYRMNVKSGITGLAQIAGRYSTSPENKLKYDLLYTKSYSPAKDIAILLQTLKVIMMKDKAS
jgi:exopolysaccharide biosynthesis polyprenyl glycosylphosphotransferase